MVFLAKYVRLIVRPKKHRVMCWVLKSMSWHLRPENLHGNDVMCDTCQVDHGALW